MRLLAFAAALCALALAACGPQPGDAAAGDAPNAASATPAAAPASPPPAEASAPAPTPSPAPTDTPAYRSVTLRGFECGDNCYLVFQDGADATATRTLLCTAPACADWQAEGRMPPSARGRTAEVELGTADQVDGAGAVMARAVPAVTDLRLGGEAKDAAAAPARPEAPLALRPGVYVLAGTGCAAPANAGFRIWNGSGLSGSATRACRATVLSRSGQRYRISNSCEATYDGARSAEELTLDIPSPTRFRMEDGAFTRCADGTASDYLTALIAR